MKKGTEKSKPEEKEENPNYKYDLLCRKAIQLPANVSSQLKCRYVHRNNPYLLIAPFKEEEVYKDPRILLYHEVLYSNEIETVKNMAKPEVPKLI